MKEELIKKLPDDLVRYIVHHACIRLEDEEGLSDDEFFSKLNRDFDTPRFILKK